MASLWSLKLASKVLVRANNLTRRKDGTLNRPLADLLETKVPACPKPVKGVATVDVVINSEIGVWVRLFIPNQETEVVPLKAELNASKRQFAKTMPVIFYYHGGGFAILCPDFLMYDAFCRRLARRCRAVVISVNYRRSPENRCPIAYDDCYMALDWLRSEASTPQLPPSVDLSCVFLSGDSAGGNIAHHVAVQAAGKDLSPVAIKGVVLIQAFFGGEERTPAELRLKNPAILTVQSADWHWKAYLPAGCDRDHPYCNIFGPYSQDLRSVPFPRTLVIVGSLDILQDWQMRYAEGLKKAGKQVEVHFYEDGIHTFGLLNQYKLANQMLHDIETFVHS